jgi:hypothetical protein
MYQVYIKTETGYDQKKLLGEFNDFSRAYEKIETELAKNKDLKYVIEERTGSVDIYGELIIDIIEEN